MFFLTCVVCVDCRYELPSGGGLVCREVRGRIKRVDRHSFLILRPRRGLETIKKRDSRSVLVFNTTHTVSLQSSLSLSGLIS